MVKTASFAPEVTTAMLSEGHQRIARSDPQHKIFSVLVLPSEGLSETLRPLPNFECRISGVTKKLGVILLIVILIHSNSSG